MRTGRVLRVQDVTAKASWGGGWCLPWSEPSIVHTPFPTMLPTHWFNTFLVDTLSTVAAVNNLGQVLVPILEDKLYLL